MCWASPGRCTAAGLEPCGWGVTASWGRGPSACPGGAAVRALVDTPGIASGLRTQGPAACTYCPAASVHLTQGPFCAEQGCLATQSFSASPLLSPGARGPSPGSQRHRKVCQPASTLLPASPPPTHTHTPCAPSWLLPGMAHAVGAAQPRVSSVRLHWACTVGWSVH